MSRFVAQIEGATAMSRTDINKVAETILVPLFAEVYGYKDLKNLNYTEDSNYPGIDLGDETARVAFQVTSTSDTKKVKHTLSKFVENKFYEKYEQLIIYILTKKQDSYSGSGYKEIIQDKFTFDKDKDIWDYRDILTEVANLQIDKARRVESILEANFGEGRRLPEWEVVDKVEEVINESTQLFVGRSEEFQKLDEFLRENSSGVKLVKAGAGFGKTALLANWVNASRDKDCFIAYHFFSQRYDVTCSVARAYRNLLRQLYIYYELTYEQPPNDENQLRERLYSILREHGAREDKPLVITLDGLDEAERPFSPPFPSPLPENVFVIASGRAEEGEKSEYLRDWIDSAESIRLKRLCRGAIANWLRQTGKGELAAFAEDTHFVAQLDEITQGFPLYLRYLTDELSHAAKQGQDVREVLAQTPKGFERYVEQQLKRLDELDLPDERWQFFALLAVAKGALEKEDVKALTGMRDRHLRQLNQSWQVTRWMRISEGKLYAFAHPLLATTFAAQLGDDAEDALQDLIDYCAKWEKYQSRYALQHYAEHLRDVKRWEELYAIARNQDFAATQREHLPDEPDLSLKTVQIALLSAADMDNAGVMAEFLLIHARRLVQTTSQESPLDALRSGSINRALALADLYDTELCVLWYLLLVWVLKDEERLEEAQRTLERLLEKELPHRAGWLSKYEAHLIMEAIDITENACIALSQKFSDNNAHRILSQYLAAYGYFTTALKVTNQIQDKSEQAWALIEISEAVATSGDLTTAQEIVDQIEDEWQRAWALGVIAKAQADLGDLPAAIEKAEQIAYKSPLVGALGAIAKAQAKTGNTETAQSTFNKACLIALQIKDELQQAEVLWRLAKCTVMAGYTKAAQSTLTIARDIILDFDNDYLGARVLRKIARSQAQLKDFSTALETIQQIGNEEERAEALKEIAEAYAQVGDFDTAREIAGLINSASQQAQAIGKIALVQAQIGDREAAQSSFATALQRAYEIDQYQERREALAEIALAQAQAADKEAAQSTFATVLETKPQFDWERKRAEALKTIAKIQEQAEDFATPQEKARRIDNKAQQQEVLTANNSTQTQVETISTALEKALLIDDDEQKSGKLAEIASDQAQKGDREAAQSTLATALVAARQIDESDGQGQSQALWAIVRVQAEIRDFVSALETAQQIKGRQRRTDAHQTIAEAQIEAREFAAALEVTKQIEDEWKRSQTLAQIAEEQVRVGLGQQALKTAETILTEREWHLPKVAAAFVRIGDKANFKRLLIPCAYYLDATYSICGQLARLYPEQAAAVAKVVRELN
jgi:hypothetical protein